MRIVFFIVLIFLWTAASRAQEKLTGNYEPYIQLEYDLTETYSHKFTIENRINWYADKRFKVNVTQLDLAHFSSFKLNDKNALALGLQYRFEGDFGGKEENEIRFTEEYKYTNYTQTTKIQHRIRTEQRIAGSSMSHRFRYKFGITRSLKGNEIDTGETYFIGNLETLLTAKKTIQPEYEQRIGVGIGWSLTDFAKLELVTEYRLDDFTKNLGHELYLGTGINFKL